MNYFRQAVKNHRLQEENQKQSKILKRIPDNEIPTDKPKMFKEAWRSQEFLVQVFEENGVERLSVVRSVLKHDDWQDGISWDELQRLKNECGRGNKWAVEVYPEDNSVVNVANMRHLWILPNKPSFAWSV